MVDEIRRWLDTGKIKIGEKLPNQNALSQEMGVSRTSLREAMRMLDLMGVIEQRPGYGTVIIRAIPELHEHNLGLSLLSDVESTYELLEARAIIECGSVKLAAKRATDEEIERFFQLVDEMAAHLQNGDYDKYKIADYTFHELIRKVSGNRFLENPGAELSSYVQQFIDENTLLLPGLLKESQRYHETICRSIARKDPDMAAQAMQEHIDRIVESYRGYLAGKEEND